MNLRVGVVALTFALVGGLCHQLQAQLFRPGTIYMDPDIITPSDPTTFTGIVYAGTGDRVMFDRRVDSFVTLNAFLFNASFSDGLSAEIEVNPEFGTVEAAASQANYYATVIGQLPTALRSDVQTVWIHQGLQPFGGGNNNLLIHTGQADQYDAAGILEETFVHEAAHTSLDATHANSPGWLAAQQADPNFISTYARDFPAREDIAESFLPYLAIRYRPDRIPQPLVDLIEEAIPNRIAYFDAHDFNMFPIQVPEPSAWMLAGLAEIGVLGTKARSIMSRRRREQSAEARDDPLAPRRASFLAGGCRPGEEK